MAINVQIKDSIDMQPRKALGVKLPFSSDSVFTSTYTSKDAIKVNLINFFLTAKGERYLNPTFGSTIKTYMFEQSQTNTAKLVEASIRQELKLFFPRVEPITITTTNVPDSNSLQFQMTYIVKQTNIEDEVVINFEQ